jgi:hypothetical protein
VFFGSQRERIHVDTSVRVASMVLEGLNDVKVGTFTLGHTVLAIELEFGSDHRVLTPAVHVKSSLSKNESAGIGHIGTRSETTNSVEKAVSSGFTITNSASHLEDTATDESIGARNRINGTKHMDGRRKHVNGISVVERLGTKDFVQGVAAFQRRAVVNVGIGLHNPDKFLNRVVEVDLDLVTGRTNRLVTSVLELLNEVLVGVGGHLSALISVKENEVNIDRGSNHGLVIGASDRLRIRNGSKVLEAQRHSPIGLKSMLILTS